MPRHQSKISFGPKRPNEKSNLHAQQSALLSKAGIQSRKVVPDQKHSDPTKAEVEKGDHDPKKIEELLQGDEAKRLLNEMWKDRITPVNKADSMPPGERVSHIFDVSMKYGPAQGITRLVRWNRAEQMGKNPPPSVKEILEEAKKSNHYKEKFEMSLFGPLQ